MTECGDLAIGQLEFYWDVHLWPRLEDLTDEEYLWEPAEGMLSLRRGVGGRLVMDEPPPTDPPPLTTIAWRMMHIGVGCFAIRVNTFFADNPDGADMFDPRHVPGELPGTAAEGLDFLRSWYEQWRGGIRALDDDGLWRPLGPKGSYFADDSMLALIVHVNREVMHHGGELGLMRDLYRAGVGR